MGGKVYPRKCPDSTLFDVVERICVHSKKALCARDSGRYYDKIRTILILLNGFYTGEQNLSNNHKILILEHAVLKKV